MTTSIRSTLVLAALLFGCGAPEPRDPPPDTYAMEEGVVKLGDVYASVPVAAVTEAFFTWSGEGAVVGRTFVAEEYGVPPEAAETTPSVVVLTHAFWSSEFSEDPGVVGRTLEVDGKPRTIVGVTAPGLAGPQGAALFVPR